MKSISRSFLSNKGCLICFRLGSDHRQTPSYADTKMSSLVSSFNPPFNSTKMGTSSRTSKGGLHLTGQDPTLTPLSDIKEGAELSMRSIASLKPDTSLSPPQMTSSKLSEYSFDKLSPNNSREEVSRALRKCFERTSWPPSPEKPAVSSPQKSESRYAIPRASALVSPRKLHQEPGVDYSRLEDSFSKLVSFGDGKEKSSWEIKSSLPGRGYFSDAVQSALSTELVTKGPASNPTEFTSTSRFEDTKKDDYKNAGRSSTEWTQPKSALLSTDKRDFGRMSRDSDIRTSGSSVDTVVKAPGFRDSKVNFSWIVQIDKCVLSNQRRLC